METMTELQVPTVNVSPSVLDSFQQKMDAFRREAPQLAADVKDATTCAAASAKINDIKRFEDEIAKSELGVARGIFDKFHRGLCRMANQFLDPAKIEKQRLQAAVDGWLFEEQRKAKATRDADAKRIADEEEERRQRDAKRMEKQGKTPEQIKSALAKPVVYVPPPIQMPEVEGVLIKEVYNIEITDVRLFLKAIIDSGPDALINEDYVEIDKAALQKLAKQRNGKLSWPGLSVQPGVKGQTRRIA